MSTQTLVTQASPEDAATATSATFLRRVLVGNSIFSISTGLICLVAATFLANLTGLQPPLTFTVLGVVLLLFGAEIGWLATRLKDVRILGRIIFALDVAWVIGSIVVLLNGWLPLTSAGMWALTIIADSVAVFAVLEYIGLRRAAVAQQR